MSGREKIKPIVPKNDINKRILDSLIEKQGNDSLYDICKKINVYPGTFRRTLETKETWHQVTILQRIADYLGKSLTYIHTGKKTPLDIELETNKEIQSLRKELQNEKLRNKKILEKIHEVTKKHIGSS